jgi:hypothetical protein
MVMTMAPSADDFRKELIDQLDRATTPEEQAYLDAGGFNG